MRTKLYLLSLFFIFGSIVSKGQTYCSTNYTSTSYYTTQVKFGTGSGANGWTNSTNAQSAGGYGNFTNNNSFKSVVKPGSTYNMEVTTNNGTNREFFVKIFFDWDNNGTFEASADFGSKSGPPYVFPGSFTVPTGANNLVTRMRVVMSFSAAATACASQAWGEAEDYSIEVCDGAANMSLTSLDVVQNNTAAVLKGSTNVEIIGFNVKTTGCGNKLQVRSASFGKADSDNLTNDATGAKLYYTGSNNSFATGTSVGVSIAPNNTFTITGIENQLPALNEGDNWFWLTYDLKPGATIDNHLDAELTSINLSGVTENPANGDPAGKRLIINSYCRPTPENATGADINKVDFGTISNTSGFAPYTSYVTTIAAAKICVGSSYDLTVSYDLAPRYVNGQVDVFAHAYFDWNRDGDFNDKDEHYYLGSDLTEDPIEADRKGTGRATITPPQHALPGASVFRVHTSRDLRADPCFGTVDGETEDYGYFLNKAGVLSPNNSAIICSADSLVLNASNTNGSFVYQFSSDRINWTDLPGSNDAASFKTPVVDTTSYVRLKGTNADCPNSESYSDIIDLAYAGINSVTQSKSQLCANDTADIAAYYEYPQAEFSMTPQVTAIAGLDKVEFNLDVSGIAHDFINEVLLDSVCLDLTVHSGADATYIYLYAPNVGDKNKILLSNGRGADNTGGYSQFCFTTESTNSIVNETGIFDGVYKSEESFNRLKGIDPNGTWTLMVYNGYTDGAVELNNFRLNFGVNTGVNWTPATDIEDENAATTRVYPSVSTTYKANLNNKYCNSTDSLAFTALSGTPITVTIDSVRPTGTICAGTMIDFYASLSENIDTPPIKWFVNGKEIVGENGLKYSSDTLKNGDVVKVDFNLITPCGTFQSDDNIAINISPVLNPVLNLVADKTFPVCEGATVKFTASATDFGPSPSYEWFVNSQSVQQGGTSYTSNVLQDQDLVEVQVSTDYPCADKASDRKGITVSTTTELDPAITLVSDANPELQCLGTDITFTADTVFNNSGGKGFIKWFVDGKEVAVPDMSTTTDTLGVGMHFIRVEYHINSSCTKAAFVSDQVTVEVGEDVIPAISFTASNEIVCKGDSIFFTVTDIVNGGTNPQIQWYRNNQQISGATTPNYGTNEFNNQDDINVRLISSIECVSFEQAFADPIQVRITQRTQTEINIKSDFEMTPFCEGTRVRVDIDYKLGGGVKPDIEWYLNETRVQKNSLEFLLIDSLRSNDKIYAKMIPNSECPTPIIPVSDTLSFTVNPLPFLDYQAVQTGDDVTFIPNSPEFSSYKWDFGNGSSSTQISPTYQYNGADDYRTCLTVVDENGCSNKKCKTVTYTPATGINSINNDKHIAIYPNPNKGQFKITGIQGSEVLSLVILDLRGNKITLHKNEISLEKEAISINSQKLASGVYLLQIQGKNKVNHIQFVIN